MVYQYGVGAWNVEKVEQRHGTNCDLMSCVSPWYHHDRTLTILKISPRLVLRFPASSSLISWLDLFIRCEIYNISIGGTL